MIGMSTSFSKGNTGQLPKKTFDLVSRGQLVGLAFKQTCISFILFTLIKTAYGHMCTIYEECNNLFYKLLKLQAFAVSTIYKTDYCIIHRWYTYGHKRS